MIQEIHESEVEGLFIEKSKTKRLLPQIPAPAGNQNNIRYALAVFLGVCLVMSISQLASVVTNAEGQREVVPLGKSLSSGDLQGQRLEFVHITETGGNLIVWGSFKSQGILWGECHFISDPDIGCDSPDIPNYLDVVGRSPWHLPPSRIPLEANPYQNAKLFTIVRNPYTRIMAEYYSQWVGSRDPEKNDPAVMNQYLQNNLMQMQSNFLSENHYIPQSAYVFDDDGKQVIDHILHFENLEEDFKKLTDAYGLNIQFDWPYHFRDDFVTNELNAQSLSPETIRMINEYAKDDFEPFGYEMVLNGYEIAV